MWKTSKCCSKDIRNSSHQILILLNLKLVCQANKTINSDNFEVELLHDEVCEAKLIFIR
jgi:hypothetical protein